MGALMRYFDRKIFAINMLFQNYLSYGYNEADGELGYNEEKTLNGFSNYDVMEELYGVIQSIDSEEYDMKNFVPKPLEAEYINSEDFSKKYQLLLEWLNQCNRNYLDNISKWESEMHDYISFFRWEKISSKVINAGIFPIKVKILFENNQTLSVIPADISWGKMEFQFLADTALGLDMEQYDGLLFWAEIDSVEEGFKFNFLINDEAQQELSIEILMKDRGWREITLICKMPKLNISQYNYALYWKETGFISNAIFLESCSALISKADILGMWYLNEKERELFNLAQLYYCFSPKLNPLISHENSIDFFKLKEFADNRIAYEQVCRLISIAGDQKFSEEVYKLCEAIENEDIRYIKSGCKRVQGILLKSYVKPAGRILYHNFANMMLEAAAEYEKNWEGRKEFLTYKDTFISLVEPSILDMGFIGEFPHYRKISKKVGEYITILNGINGDNSTEENCINTWIVIGRGPIKKESENYYSLAGLDFYKSNAWDCLWQGNKYKTATIAPYDDNECFKIKCNNNEEKYLNEQVSSMIPYIEVAKSVFNNKPLPKFYLRHHRKYLETENIIKKILSLIPLYIVFSSISYWILGGSYDLFSFLMSCIFGLFFGIFFGGYIIHDIKHKIWHM